MNNPRMADLEFFERSCCMFLLRYIYHHPGLNKSMLMSTEGKSLSTKNRHLDELETMGLIEDESENVEGRRRGTYYRVTLLGSEIVEHLDEIYRLMEYRLSGVNDDYTVYIDPRLDEKIAHHRETKDVER